MDAFWTLSSNLGLRSSARKIRCPGGRKNCCLSAPFHGWAAWGAGMETRHQLCFLQELVPSRDRFSATPWAGLTQVPCPMVHALCHAPGCTEDLAEASPAPCSPHCRAAALLRTASDKLDHKPGSKQPKTTGISFQAPLPDTLFWAQIFWLLVQLSFLMIFKPTFLFLFYLEGYICSSLFSQRLSHHSIFELFWQGNSFVFLLQ